MDTLKKLIKSYETWVAANPETVSDVETTSKWVSYFIAGRISDSTVVSELIYSLSNLLVLYNDRIMDRAAQTKALLGSNDNHTDRRSICYRLKVILSTLEYCEVFIEISAKRVFGVRGKWLFVALLQVAKAAGRFFILKHSTESIITTPAIPALNRRQFAQQLKNSGAVIDAANTTGAAGDAPAAIEPAASFSFKLKRSGRVVRKVEGAPPLQYRDFRLQQEVDAINRQQEKPFVPSALMRAEYLYIAKPLIHLATMGIFGDKCWKQYSVALTLDLYSIHLYYKNRQHMTKQQKLEMSRRCINLLMYLMRSPFYEGYTQRRLERLLGAAARNLPFVKMIANPLLEYIPHWQSTYFYLWAT